ncbi:MAG: GntR family transcriptional regulator [Anaerohalosphaeraceae bacterium]|nr:GntR family transcriptional regulator [Anaerohalosphaeraceae bacterium]
MDKTPAIEVNENETRAKFAHEKLYAKFLEQLRNGKWPKNAMIPSEHQLAKECNSSRETIRKALGTLENEGYLQAERGRGRIVSAIPESPNSSSTKTIGLLVSELSIDAYGEFSQIHQTLSENNQNLTIYTLKPDSTARPLENISHNNTSGVLAYSQQILKSDIVEFNKTIPTVSLMHRCSDFGIPSFYLSWNLAAYQCSTHLFERGFKSQFLELSTVDYHSNWVNEFSEGVSCAHFANGLQFDSQQALNTTRITDDIINSDFENIFDELKKHKKVGVVTYFSKTTVDLIEIALKRGIKIPEQLGITCIMDTNKLTTSPVPVTAVSFNRLEMVEQATKTLLKMVQGENIEKKDNPFFGALKIRSSS